MNEPEGRDSPTALVLAPLGRDAAIAASILGEVGIIAEICPDLPAVIRLLNDDVGLAIVTEDAIRTADIRPLAAWLERQPPWSDFPFVLLTKRGGGTERNPVAARLSEVLGNVTFLERPFHPTTLVSVVGTALRGRRRQYEARARLEELRRGEDRLRTALAAEKRAQEALQRLNETLEQRVEERAAQLAAVSENLTRQVAERERAEEKLRQAQKMEAIGQLTGGMAHDFNNLLMAVIGNLDLLQKRLPDDPRMQRMLSGALQGAQRGAALTQRLLAFARRQDLQPQSVDLVRSIEDMKPLLERSVGPLVDIRMDLPSQPPLAMVDPNQFELALLNLAVNARDAMPEGGILTVAVATVAADKSVDLEPGTYATVSITDTGTGMDPQTLRKAVEPFFSTKELGKGTGLGLSMVHGLAVQSGGTLQLDSVIGVGTTARLWLPAADAPPLAPFPKPPKAHKSAAPVTVLLVDDDALIAMSTSDMLEDLGHQVIEAHSGTQALDILRSGAPIDVLITDHAMPGMTGVDLVHAARELRPDLPALLATGYAELPERIGLDLPRLPKPYHQRQLEAELSALLENAEALQEHWPGQPRMR